MDKTQKSRVTAMEADREAAGLSFRSLGQAAGVSDGNIRDLVKGRRDSIGDDNWAKLAAALRTHFQASERAQSGASRTEDSKLAALLEKDGIEIPAPAARTAPVPAQAGMRQPGGGAPSGIVSIPFGLLRPNPQNYRKTFLPEDIEQLAESIAEKGLLQNLVVFPAGKDGIHTINSGGRRYAALNLLFNARRIDADYPVACLVKDMKQDEARALALIENLQRQDVPVLEEAEGFKALTALGWDTEKIAGACHIAQRTVQDRLQLFDKLKPVARAALSRGEITLDQARAIVSTPVEAEQNELVTFAVRNGYNAAALRDKAKAGKVRVSKAEFDLKLYKGEFIGTGADRVFADTAAFMKLQMKEAKKKADELRESGRFKSVTLVEPGEEGFAWQAYDVVLEEHVTAENAATLDVWVSIDRWSHAIKVDYGRLDSDAAAEDPFAEDVAEEEKHAAQTDLEREIARKRREEELARTVKWLREMRRAVAERPADLFRAQIFHSFAGQYHPNRWLAPQWQELSEWTNLPGTVLLLQEATGIAFHFEDMPEDRTLSEMQAAGELHDCGCIDIPDEREALRNALDLMPDKEVIALFAALDASRTTLLTNQTLDLEAVHLSWKLGVTVPDHLLPEPEEKDEEEDGADLDTEEAA